MAIKPILFNTEMVRAILDGRKACTRRVVKPQPDEKHGYALGFITNCTEKKNIGSMAFGAGEYSGSIQYARPPYQPGDILYVRETWQRLWELDGNENVIAGTDKYYYKATDTLPTCEYIDPAGKIHENIPWRPSIHMPKEAARIWLRVTDVRVERLQDITEMQTEEEGFLFTPPCLHRTGETYCDIDGPCESKIKYCDMSSGELFGNVLWNKTIKKSDLDRYGWNANPYVFVIEFERCEKPEEGRS